MKCEKCGAEMKRGDKFCNACGSKISNSKPSLQGQLKDFTGKVSEFGESIDWEQKSDQFKDKLERLKDKGSEYFDKVESKIEARKQEKEEKQAQVEREEYFENVSMKEAYPEPVAEEVFPKEPIQQPKKRKTWLWVLGWIFIFPVPLTFILLKKTNMNKIGKYVAIAVAWLFYFFIIWPTGSSEQTDTQSNEPATVVSVEQPVEQKAEVAPVVSFEEPTNEMVEVAASVPEKKEETKVSFTSQVNAETGFILFKVTSNLPEDTKLVVKASNTGGYEETDTVIILADGEGNSKEFFSSDDAPDGTYTISVESEDGEEYCSRNQSFTNKERAVLAKAEEEAKAKELAAAGAAKAEAEKKSAEAKPEFTFTDCSGIKYPSIDMNVRNKPNTSGDKVGSVSKNQEVVVTGKCNETGWYRIKYGDGEAYAHNAYLLDEKTVDAQVATVVAGAGVAAAGGAAASSGGGNSISGSLQNDPIPSGPMYIGNINNMKLHRVSCSGKLPKEENRVYFNTLAEAEAAGFTRDNQCKNCYPFN